MTEDKDEQQEHKSRERPRPLETPIGSAPSGADPDHPSGQPPAEAGTSRFPTGEEQAERNRADESPA